NMSIFQDFPTQRWAILVKRSSPQGKPRRGAQMASISNRSCLGRATSPPGGNFGPICSPFGRLDGAVYEFTT
ncbi:hypothetical protein, partial [uncultured Novosphingobium sp.]|uniref:hypothetical protein n=1 Tax=uncultured Novosphingobium sp. TaxID=292277 RepID=UPI00259A190B